MQVFSFFFFFHLDLPSQLNTEKFIFQSVLNLKVKKRSSLAFVIDKSTSMKEEIKQVTKWTVDKVSSVIGSPMEPANYVLVTFSDPGMYNYSFLRRPVRNKYFVCKRQTWQEQLPEQLYELCVYICFYLTCEL